MRRTILSLCDYSGTWSAPYAEAGYDVIQVDLKLGGDAILWPSAPSDTPRFSSDLADVRQMPQIHGVIAQPVCTYFSNAGAKHPRTDEQLREGLALVDACLRIVTATRPQWWVLENPVGKLVKWIGPYRTVIQPWKYAGWADDPDSEAYTKATCLWGSFNADLPESPVEPVLGSKMWAQYGGASERTKEMRSMTPQGFSRAFARVNP